jgi:hypothetical protein
MIFEGCLYLESIKIQWDSLNENELLDFITDHSPMRFHELRLSYSGQVSTLGPEELEASIVKWMDKRQQSLSLIIVCNESHTTLYELFEIVTDDFTDYPLYFD